MLALPTPIWEEFAAIRQQGERNPVKSGETLQLKGCVIDSRLLGLSADGLIAPIREETEDEIFEVLPRRPPSPSEPVPEPEPEPEPVPLDWRRRLVIASTTCCCGTGSRQRPGTHTGTPLAVPSPAPAAAANGAGNAAGAIAPGHRADAARRARASAGAAAGRRPAPAGRRGRVVYVSVFNPLDGRNWHHLITAFCWAFRDTSDATLVLKMTQSDLTTYHVELLTLLSQLSPFACRVIALHGYLDAAEYARLYGAASLREHLALRACACR